jgi:hypothetical protein
VVLIVVEYVSVMMLLVVEVVSMVSSVTGGVVVGGVIGVKVVVGTGGGVIMTYEIATPQIPHECTSLVELRPEVNSKVSSLSV